MTVHFPGGRMAATTFGACSELPASGLSGSQPGKFHHLVRCPPPAACFGWRRDHTAPGDNRSIRLGSCA